MDCGRSKELTQYFNLEIWLSIVCGWLRLVFGAPMLNRSLLSSSQVEKYVLVPSLFFCCCRVMYSYYRHHIPLLTALNYRCTALGLKGASIANCDYKVSGACSLVCYGQFWCCFYVDYPWFAYHSTGLGRASVNVWPFVRWTDDVTAFSGFQQLADLHRICIRHARM